MLKPEPVLFGYKLSQLRDMVVNRPFKTEIFIGPFHWWGKNVYEFVVHEELLIEFREEPYYYRSEVSNEWDFQYHMHMDVRRDLLLSDQYGITIFKWIQMRAAHYLDENGISLSRNIEFQILQGSRFESNRDHSNNSLIPVLR
jgi:hypothetical protein